MTKNLQQIIEEIKTKLDLHYKSERQDLEKRYINLKDGQFYSGKCEEASEIALTILEEEGYSEYQLGECYVGSIPHSVLYKEVKNDSLVGVIDMTANQFHDLNAEEIDSYVLDYLEEFKKYSYGIIDDKHSLKHYKINRTD